MYTSHFQGCFVKVGLLTIGVFLTLGVSDAVAVVVSTSFEGVRDGGAYANEDYALRNVVGEPLGIDIDLMPPDPVVLEPGWNDGTDNLLWEGLASRVNDQGYATNQTVYYAPNTSAFGVGPSGNGFAAYEGESVYRQKAGFSGPGGIGGTTPRVGVKREIPTSMQAADTFQLSWAWRVQSVRHEFSTPMDYLAESELQGRAYTSLGGKVTDTHALEDAVNPHDGTIPHGMDMAQAVDGNNFAEGLNGATVFSLALDRDGTLVINEKKYDGFSEKLLTWDGTVDPYAAGAKQTISNPDKNILSGEYVGGPNDGQWVDDWGVFGVEVDTINETFDIYFQGGLAAGAAFDVFADGELLVYKVPFIDPGAGVTVQDISELALESGLVWGDAVNGAQNKGAIYWDDIKFDDTPLLNPADFNTDTDVDATDLAIWEAGFGTGTTRAEGDAWGDGTVGGNDFLLWQSEFGSTGGAAIANVPEPSTAVLGGLLLLCFATGRRAKR